MADLEGMMLEPFRKAVQAVMCMRRTKHIGLGVLIVLILFGLLGFFAAPPLIRHIAEQQLSQQLDRPATIQRIALNPYTLNLEVDGIHLGERGGQGDFVDIGKLVVRPSWTSLFRGAPIINEVRLDAPRFWIVRYDAQRCNFTDLIEKFSKPPKPDSKPTYFSISNIQINDGRIDFDDRLLNEKHVVDHWTLGIPYIATLPSKTDIFVEPKLRARFDGSPIELDGKTKPFAQSRESEIELKFDQLDVPKLMSYVPAKLPVAVQSGLLSSNLTVNFVMSGAEPALRVSGTVDLNDAKVTSAASEPLFAAHGVHVAAASLEPLRGVLHFDEIRLDQPVVDLARDRQGVLNVEKLVAKPAGASKAASRVATPGAKPMPLGLTIRHFAIDGGTINFDDRVPAKSTMMSLTQLAATLDGLTLQGKTPAKYRLSTTLSHGGDVKAEGAFNLAAKQIDAKLTIDAFALPALQPYFGKVMRVRMLDGTLGATVNAKADWGKTPLDAQVVDSEVSLKSLKIATPNAKALSIVLPDARAKVTKVDLATRTAQITSVDATGLALDVTRLKNGQIDLAALAGPAQPVVSTHTVGRKAKTTALSWHYQIDALNVKDASANFTDLSTPRPVKLAIKPLQLSVEKISDDLTKPLPVKLQATLNRKGALNVSGDVTAQPLKLGLKINGNRLDAAAFEPYFGSALNATIASARLNANGNLTVAQAKDAMRASYRGDAALVDVRMLDKVTSGPFGGWRSLALSNLKATYDEHGTDVDAARVTSSNFYGRVLLDAQGRLNLKGIVAKQTGPAQSLTRDTSNGKPVPLPPQGAPAVVKTATTTQNPVRLHVGELVLQNGRVNYTDNFVKPNYSANLIAIKGSVGAFGTDSTTPAPVDIAANLAGNGPIAIKGTVNPLIEKPALDLTAVAHDIELTNLTPYSAKYAGYPITKGKLNVDLHYQLANDQLSANNHIFIDQLTFGDHVDNDTATKLPVKLAISLLKNSRGEIDVNLPVSGSLSNPEFAIGGLIWRAVLNLIAKAVTSPFTLLTHAFGSGGEELGYVEFAPGSSDLSDAQQKKLDTVVKMLTEKSSIRLDLIGRIDPDRDTPGLRDAYVDRLVRQQKLKDVVGQGESVDPRSVKIEPAEYHTYLTRAYKTADFKKPRNLIGLQKTLPDDDMKQAIAEHAPVDEGSLRLLAQQRTQAVREYLEGKIDASRMFVVAPKLDTKGIEDKGAMTRVDLGLEN